LETCGGLAIRLPPLDAPLRSVENRRHLRLAAMRGRMESWLAAKDLPIPADRSSFHWQYSSEVPPSAYFSGDAQAAPISQMPFRAFSEWPTIRPERLLADASAL
jgi:hypothetical protein